MSMYLFPDYLKFIKNEKKTLAFLANDPFIRKNFGVLSSRAESCYFSISSMDKILKNSGLSFGCNFDIKIEKQIRRIAIEAHVQPKFGIVSYVLSICENDKDPLNLIRKFHFDYAIPNEKEDSKPVYHLQYGGEASPQIKELELNIDSLYPFISSPRIQFYPMNLALLLDMIFKEFLSDETKHLVERSEWRGFIKLNEDFVLRPYYVAINHFLNSGHSSKFLLRDLHYGKSNL